MKIPQNLIFRAKHYRYKANIIKLTFDPFIKNQLKILKGYKVPKRLLRQAQKGDTISVSVEEKEQGIFSVVKESPFKLNKKFFQN